MSEPTVVRSEEHDSFQQEAVRNQKLLTGLSRCLEQARVKHSGTREQAVYAVKTALEADGITFVIGDRNWVKAMDRTGASTNLQERVDRLLLDPSLHIGDMASIQSAVADGQLDIKAKSDLSTAAQKSAAIAKYGFSWWNALPAQREAVIDMNPATMTAKDYGRLSVKQRLELQHAIHEQQGGNLRAAEKVLGGILQRR